MSPPDPVAPIAPAPAGGSALPPIAAMTARIAHELALKGALGLLSVSVLQQPGAEDGESWAAYEETLREITEFLSVQVRGRLRNSDGLFSPGANGNGFAVLLDRPRSGRMLDAADVSRVRARLRRSLRVHLAARMPHGAAEGFGCFVGGAVLRPRHGVPIERLVHRALEEAFADALRDREREDRRNVATLKRVLELGDVRAVYQPILDIVERRVLGLEALARFPRGRASGPETMFRVAQERDALWRLERLCRRRAVEGLPALRPGQLLFLNVEPDGLSDPELLEDGFRSLLERAGLTPRDVVFEVTERSAMRDFDAMRRTLAAFRDHGFRLAMDDVGSGYAGLQAIAELSPDFLKVDMALVRDLDRHPIKRELVATIRRFADATGITLVAEGVETAEELESLLASGVRCAQGFLFARPAPLPELSGWEPAGD